MYDLSSKMTKYEFREWWLSLFIKRDVLLLTKRMQRMGCIASFATEQKFEMCCIERLELFRLGKERTGKYSPCDESLTFKVMTCLFNRTKALL